MNRITTGAAIVLLAALSGSSLKAGLISYANRGLFDAANPGLPIEDFEEAVVTDGSINTFTGPANSATSTGGLSPGNILAGLSLADFPGPDESGLLVGGIGLFPGSTKNIGSDTFADSLDILFSPGTQAVAFDLLHSPGPGDFESGILTIEVFGAGGSLGVFTPSVSGIAFFGVLSDADAITRINLFSGVDGAEFVDNIAFNAAAVPEPATILMAGLGLGLAVVARRRIARKRA